MSSDILADFFFGIDLSERVEGSTNYEIVEKLREKLKLESFDGDELEVFLEPFGFEIISFGYESWESRALAIIETHRNVNTGCLELENFICDYKDYEKYNLMFNKLLTELDIFNISYTLNWHLSSYLG